MSTLLNEKEQSKLNLNNLNLYNIEPDSIINLSFNFDILKFVITELITKQKNMNDELIGIKSELLQQKKYSNEIEVSLVELKLSIEKNDIEIQKSLENQKNKLNMQLEELEKQIKNQEFKTYIGIPNNINEKNLNDENNNININNENKENIKNNINNNTLNKETNLYNENKISNISYQEISEEIKTIINDIKKIKENHTNLEKDFNQYKNDTDKNITKKIGDSTPAIENNLASEIKLLERNLNNKIIKNLNDFNSFKEEYEQKNKIIEAKVSQNNVTNKVISEMKGGIDLLTEKVNTLNDSFAYYTKISDFKKYKDDMFEYIKNIREDINKNVELLRRGFNTLKTQVSEHLNDKSDHNNLDLLLKRFEIAQTMIYKLKDFQKEMEDKEKKRIIIDPNHFIDKEIFENFLKSQRKDFDEYKKDFVNLRSDLENLKNKEDGNKASLKDLKSLEDNILKRFEDFKHSISKRFVDKNTLNKNKKIIEMQTKQLIEENKKEEKKDNWLLSKKPINGHLCASCESIINDLNQDIIDKYIPWNKYPQKDPPEKVYKIDGGISKLINIFNSELNKNKKNKNNINNTSLDNSSNILKTSQDENDKSRPNSRNSLGGSNSNNKKIQVNSFSSDYCAKKKYKIINENEIENITNLPMIPKTIRHLDKNNSSINLFSSENLNLKKVRNMIRSLKSNKNFKSNKKVNINLIKKKISLEEADDLNENNKDKNKINDIIEPKITKIIKKH